MASMLQSASHGGFMLAQAPLEARSRPGTVPSGGLFGLDAPAMAGSVRMGSAQPQPRLGTPAPATRPCARPSVPMRRRRSRMRCD